MAHTGPADFQTQVRRSDCRVYSRNWPLIMRVKWAPFFNFEDPFSRNGAKNGGSKSKKTECFLRLLTFYMGHTCWMLCRHFGTFWATEKAWAKITAHPRCLSGKIMIQMKKRKAIETVRGHKNSKYVYKAAVSVLVSKVFEYLI